MRNTNKKGFTIVELVIVVAVIAILAAVLIPTFSGIIRKANESKDTQLVKHLNTAIAADVDGDKTIVAAIAAAAEFGFDLPKITAKVEGNEILWDSVNNVFCYLNDGKIEYLSDVANKGEGAELWMISKDEISEEYSTYYYGGNVESNTSTKICVVTDGEDITIKAPNATVLHYGDANQVIIEAVASASYHEFGKANFTQIKSGRYVMESTGSTNALVVVTGATVASGNEANITAKYEVEAGADVSDIVAGATNFAGGLGTEENPYLIKTAEHLQNIGANYANHAYYKVADGVESIDCSNWACIDLNGSFNGNGAILNNVDSVLFNNVGTGADGKKVVIENFTIKFVGGAGIARVCATSNLTFKNINATGYLIEDWNGAIFLRYGTNNYNDGFNYIVNFENCGSTAEIYCTINNYSSILVGHTYPGLGTATINVDVATDSAINSTVLYYRGAEKTKVGYKYFGAGDATLNIGGVASTKDAGKLTGDNVVAVDVSKLPTKEDGVWGITTEADATKIVISVNWQYTLYTNNYGEKIADQSGVGGIVGTPIVIEVASGEDVQLLDKIESVEIKTGADKFDYEIVNGKLTIYMTTDNKFVDGNLTLTVEQYTSGNSIAKYTGTVTIATKTTSADFIIK